MARNLAAHSHGRNMRREAFTRGIGLLAMAAALAYHAIWSEGAPAEKWPRLMDAAEPMHVIGAFTGARLDGIAHFIFHWHTRDAFVYSTHALLRVRKPRRHQNFRQHIKRSFCRAPFITPNGAQPTITTGCIDTPRPAAR